MRYAAYVALVVFGLCMAAHMWVASLIWGSLVALWIPDATPTPARYEEALREITFSCRAGAHEGSICTGRPDCRISEHYCAYKALGLRP